MSGLALWGANEFSQMLFGRRTVVPDNYYLALIRQTAPNAFSDGVELDEPPAGVGYGRLLLPNDATVWTTDGYYLTTNVAALTFLQATADWGRINYWALTNAPEDGFVYFTGRFPQAEIIYNNDQVIIPAGALQIALGPIFGVDSAN